MPKDIYIYFSQGPLNCPAIGSALSCYLLFEINFIVVIIIIIIIIIIIVIIIIIIIIIYMYSLGVAL